MQIPEAASASSVP